MKIEEREIKGASKLYVAQSQMAPPDMRARPHRHSFYEIAWLEYGGGRFICDFQDYELQAGALVFTSPGQVHTWETHDDYNLILIGFKPSLFAQNWINPALLSVLPYFDLSATPCMVVPAERQHVFGYLFSTIFGRYDELGVLEGNYIELSEAHEHILLAYLHLILVEAERLYSAEVPPNAHTTSMKQLTVSFQTKVEETYTQRLRIQDYAIDLGITANYLAEVCRQTMGKSPSEFVQQRLLLEAQRLLAFTDDTVAQVAEQLSFATPTQFGQWFKKHAGVSPGKFRK